MSLMADQDWLGGGSEESRWICDNGPGWLTGLILRILDLSVATISKLIVCGVLCERWVMTRRHKSVQILELGSSKWSNNTTWAGAGSGWMNYDHYTWSILQLIYSAINKMITRDKAGPLNLDKRKTKLNHMRRAVNILLKMSSSS